VQRTIFGFLHFMQLSRKKRIFRLNHGTVEHRRFQAGKAARPMIADASGCAVSRYALDAAAWADRVWTG
jgi:hypothetical protein